MQCLMMRYVYGYVIVVTKRTEGNECMRIAFGKNEQVKRVFWTLFVSIAGLVLAWVVDPEFDQQVVGIIVGV